MPQDLTIRSLRGGLNTTDPLVLLRPDECSAATNVEFFMSALGERRAGMSAVSLGASGLGGSAIVLLHRHLPSDDETAAQLWAISAVMDVSAVVAYKDTAWHAVSADDPVDPVASNVVAMQMVSLHNKLFISGHSAVTRMHVYDVATSATIRRTGLQQPAAPVLADTAGGGSYTGVRYGRVRYVIQVAGVTVLRSEPSATTTFTPVGSKDGITISKPAAISEHETHYEVELSIDNANFYRVSTVAVGVSSYTDSTAYATGYNTASNTLSEAIGDYALIPSALWLIADADRLMWAGSFETTGGSRVGWTVVSGSPGVGNDERVPTATNNTLDLDQGEGGIITGLGRATNGLIYVFKFQRIYRLTRNNIGASNAYSASLLTTTRGAIPGSVVAGVDAQSQPCIWFLDPFLGICQLGVNGLVYHRGLRATWARVNLDAASRVVARALFYPTKKQVWFTVAADGATAPTLMLKVQVNDTKITPEGMIGGVSIATGLIAGAYAMTLFASNIEAGTARSLSLVPVLGLPTPNFIQIGDTGTTDNGTAYVASMTTAPLVAAGILNRFGVRAAALVAVALANTTVNVSLVRDFGVETVVTTSLALAPAGAETDVIVAADNLEAADVRALHVIFADGAQVGQWQLNQFAMQLDDEEKP